LSLAKRAVIDLFRETYVRNPAGETIDVRRSSPLRKSEFEGFIDDVVRVTEGEGTSEFKFFVEKSAYKALKYIHFLQNRTGTEEKDLVRGFDPTTLGAKNGVSASSFFEILSGFAAQSLAEEMFGGKWIMIPSPKRGADGGADFFLIEEEESDRRFDTTVIVGQSKLYAPGADTHFRKICRDVVGTSHLFLSADYSEHWTEASDDTNISHLERLRGMLRLPFVRSIPCLAYLGGVCKENDTTLGSPLILSHTTIARYASQFISDEGIQTDEEIHQEIWEKMFAQLHGL